MSTGWWIAIGIILAILAGVVFYSTLSRYQRISGYAFDLAILRTLAFLVVLVGIGALAWWGAGLLFAPGRWRDVAIFLGFSVLEATLGRGAMNLFTRVLEVRYHL